MRFGIGQPVRRREGLRRLRGAGRQVDDITLPGQAHAAVLRSPVAHGVIRRLDARAARARGRHRGIGIAYHMERTGGPPTEVSRLSLTPDGRLRLWIGTQTTGQGHETAWAQIAHETPGIDFARIEVMAGDSDALPRGGGTGGSRSLIMAGRVIPRGADEIIRKGRALAAERLEAAEADTEFAPREVGTFRITGTDRAVTPAELAEEPGEITAEGRVDDTHATFPNGCHVGEVEIDGETGRLSPVRYTIADDFGRLINPALVAGQVHGGVAQDVGQVIGEEMRWDLDTVQPLTASFMDYPLPRARDLPSFDLSFLEVPPPPTPWASRAAAKRAPWRASRPPRSPCSMRCGAPGRGRWIRRSRR